MDRFPGLFENPLMWLQEKELGGDFEKVVEIFPGESAITTGSDPKPILVTYDIGSCVSLTGFNPEARIGFLNHFKVGTDIGHELEKLRRNISQVSPNKLEFNIRLKGGHIGMSENLVQEIIRNLIGFSEFHVVEKDLLKGKSGYKSAGINTRSGKIITRYNPFLNPFHQTPPLQLTDTPSTFYRYIPEPVTAKP